MNDRAVPRDKRSFGAFLRAIRSQPTFWVQTLAVASFALASALKGGFVVMLGWAAAGLAVMIGVGYPLFRRRGRIG